MSPLHAKTLAPSTRPAKKTVESLHDMLCHCGEPVEYGYNGNPDDHRGMCSHCEDYRCDLNPENCGKEDMKPTEMSIEAAARAMYEQRPKNTDPKHWETPWEDLPADWKAGQMRAAERVLQAAGATGTDPITQERAADWGDPVGTHIRIAQAWSGVLDHEVTPHDVALCMAALKLIRASINPDNADSYVDGRAYMQIAQNLTIGD